MKHLLMPLVLLACSCTSSTPVRGPSGEQWVFIQCDTLGIEYCYEKAAKECPRGYKMINVTNETIPRILFDPVYNRNITIDCN